MRNGRKKKIKEDIKKKKKRYIHIPRTKSIRGFRHILFVAIRCISDIVRFIIPRDINRH